MIPEHISKWYFDFTHATIGKVEVSDTAIRVPISNFGVLKDYPGYEHYTKFERCTLVYEGVIRSARIVQEYINITPDKWTGFKPEYTITDGPFTEASGDKFAFFISAVSDDLRAWVHWEITASSVRIEANSK